MCTHAHAVLFCCFNKHPVYQPCSFRIESAGRSSAKSIAGFFPACRATIRASPPDRSRAISSYGGIVVLVDEISGTVDGVFLGIIDVIKCMRTFSYPIITVEGKRPLEHDCGPVHYAGLLPISLLVPEIDINSTEIAATLGTFFASAALNVHERTAIAGSHVIDDGAFRRRLFDTPQKVHEHAFTGFAPPDDADRSPLPGISNDTLFRTLVSSKSMERSYTLMNGFGIFSSPQIQVILQ